MDDQRASRRRFVGTLAGLSVVGLSGCGSGDGTDTPEDEDETPMPTPTATPSDDDKGTTTGEPTATATDAPTATPTDAPTDAPTETPTDPATPTPSAGDLADWTTYMYNNQNWGVHPDASGPHGDVSVAWERDLEAAEVNATPVLAGGRLYVGDGRPTDETGTLYSLDPITGETNWSLELSGPVLGGTVVDENGWLYIAAGGDVKGLRPDGSELWSFVINGDLTYASPTVTSDHVHFGADSGRLFKYNKMSSARTWTYNAFSEIPSAPIVSEDRVYLADRAGGVTALDDAEGTEDWVVEPSDQVNGLSMRDERLFAATEDGSVTKLDTLGNVLWSRSAGSGAATTPAITEDLVYVGTRSTGLVALDRGDGIEQWRFDDTTNAFSAPPVVVEDTVYVGCKDNNVYALDANSGDQQWSFATNNDIVSPAPVVAGGTVYIGSRDGRFYALSE